MIDIVKKKRARRSKPELSVVKDEPISQTPALPDFIAVGLIRYKDNTYSQATVEVRGEVARVIEVDEPNMRAIAIDSLKIAVMKRVIDASSL